MVTCVSYFGRPSFDEHQATMRDALAGRVRCRCLVYARRAGACATNSGCWFGHFWHGAAARIPSSGKRKEQDSGRRTLLFSGLFSARPHHLLAAAASAAVC